MHNIYLGLHQIFIYFEAVVQEATIRSFPPPTCISRHPGAILLHDYWTVYNPPRAPDLSCVCVTPYNIGNNCLCVSCMGRAPCVGRSLCVSDALCVGALCVGRSLVGPSPPVSDPRYVDIRSRDGSRSSARSHGWYPWSHSCKGRATGRRAQAQGRMWVCGCEL